MEDWWLDVLRSRLAAPVPTIGIELFRVAFAASCAMKFAVETKRGYFDYFKPHTFLYFSYRVAHPKTWLTEERYKLLYVAKCAAAVALLLGLGVHAALAVIAAALFVELRVYFKFHANLMFLIAATLFAFGPTPTLSIVAWSKLGVHGMLDAAAAAKGSPLAQLMLMATLVVVYTATAVRKCNAVFLTGKVVAGTLDLTLREAPRRKHFDGIYPSSLAGWLRGDRAELTRRFGWAMVLVVALELALPVLLLHEPWFVWACVAGAVMHVLFMLLFPATLAHFSILTVSLYVLFVDPSRLARVCLALNA